jgi:5-methylcytosine-specific restriction endonuclease McrA
MAWLHSEISRYQSGWRRLAVIECDRCKALVRRRPSDPAKSYCTKRCANIVSTAKLRTPTGPDGSKPCASCLEIKTPSEFYTTIRDHGRVSLGSHCRQCCAVRGRERAGHNAVLDRKRYDAKVAAGVCTECGTRPVSSESVRCDFCRQRKRYERAARVAERRANGICTSWSCKLPALAGSLCLDCWFRRVATDTLGSRQSWAELKDLWLKQDGMCALTGSPLVPGAKRVALDHIVPKARGGGNEISNLRWVTFEVNRAKSDMLDEDFVEMCRRVVERRTECRPPLAKAG